METSWKWLSIFYGLLLQRCNGFPIGLEDTVADKHTQFITGLVAVLLTVCSIVFLVGCLCCQRRHGFKEFRDSPVISSTLSNLDHGHVNPVSNGEFTIFTPLSPPHYNNNIFLANERIVTRTSEDYIYGDFDVSSWFHESEKDFPRIKLKYIKELGRGWFGKVVEGAAKDLQNENDHSWTPVVVKILEATASRKERVMFLNDAAIYKCGSHVNILSLLGRCLDTVPLLLLLEYCPQGDLKSYLRSKKENADSLLSTHYPLLWCCQLTSALKHLHGNKVTHPDLAARNCQLTSNLILKLGDYGLAAFNYPDDYYQGSPGIPVRWCSPESLTCTLTTIQPKKITPESNIWSLGVTIWEIYECGEQPYPFLNDDEVISQVLGSNVRLDRPKYAVLYIDYIYRLMQLCWTNAELRPSVSQINLLLNELLEVQKCSKTNSSTDEFDRQWELFKPNSLIKADSISDGVNAEAEESEVNITKPLSPSLNNLHGSLDNLLVDPSEIQINSWLENGNQINDSLSAKEISIQDDSVLEASISDSSDQSSPKLKTLKSKSKLDFHLSTKHNKHYNFSNNMLFSQRTSSESETEDENWRSKVESGAYTEKVRIKSRSVTDLMVLTHVDYSESESETPFPSLDFRINYKNVRYIPKSNSENVSLTYGSEGNLLNIQDTFQDELKKLQEERRDSLLFVPDNHSQLTFNKSDNKETLVVEDSTLSDLNSNKMHVVDSPDKRLMLELNSTAEIKPANQVFNVFNVTIDKFKPMHVSSKLNEIINLNEEINNQYKFETKEPIEMMALKESKGFVLDEQVHCVEDDHKANDSTCETNIQHIISDLKNEACANTENTEIHQSDHTGPTELVKINKEELPFSEQIHHRHNDGPKSDNSTSETDITYISELSNEAYLYTENIENHQNSNNKTEEVIKAKEPNDLPVDELPCYITNDIHNSNNSISEADVRHISDLNKKICTDTINTGIPEKELTEVVESKHLNELPLNEQVHSVKSDIREFNSSSYEIDMNHISGIPHLEFPNTGSTESHHNNKKISVEIVKLKDPNELHIRESNSSSSKADIKLISDLANKESPVIKNAQIEQNNKEAIKVIKLQDSTEVLFGDQVHCNKDDICEFNSSTWEVDIRHLPHLKEETTSGAENTEIYENNLKLGIKQEIRTEMVDEANGTTQKDINDLNPHTGFLEDGNYAENLKKVLNPDILVLPKVIIQSLPNTSCDNKDSIHREGAELKLVEEKTQSNNAEQSESHSLHDNRNKENLLQSEVTYEQNNNCKQNGLSTDDSEKGDSAVDSLKVEFDLSSSQKEIMPNELTHSNIITSTPFRKKQDIPLPPENIYSSINLFGAPTESDDLEGDTEFSLVFAPLEKDFNKDSKDLNYSLETWDNFLGKTLDDQSEVLNENLFDSFSSEPHSLLFIENKDVSKIQDEHSAVDNLTKNNQTDVLGTQNVNNDTYIKNETFVIEDNKTFVVDNSKIEDDKIGTVISSDIDAAEHTSEDEDGNHCDWETKGGWFLHPQTANEEISGSIDISSASASSYVGFGIDDEIMAAIRNELLTKLPHAQGTCSEKVKEADEWDSSERDEVFLKYNVYNPPLSPILEESYIDESAEAVTSRQESENEDSEWSEHCIPEPLPPDTGSQSAQTESLFKGPHHQHTPSQESCCSNDTLFNLDDLTYTVIDLDKENDIIPSKIADETSVKEVVSNETVNTDVTDNTQCTLCDNVNETEDVPNKEINIISQTMNSETNKIEGCENLKSTLKLALMPFKINEIEDFKPIESQMEDSQTGCNEDKFNDISTHTNQDDTYYINEFILHERKNYSDFVNKLDKPPYKENTLLGQNPSIFINTKVAPLPSPEDNPWKQLPASMLSYDKIVSQNSPKILPTTELQNMLEYENLSVNKYTIQEYDSKPENTLNEQPKKNLANNDTSYVNCNVKDDIIEKIYENIENVSDIYNEADYVNIINLENTKNHAGYINLNEKDDQDDLNNVSQSENKLDEINDDIFGMLTDIKFNGPGDSQIMSTSFSESNDLNGEQDWDSGSDTRSSSSGEFIWKEGEHEESLKALQAAPQDVLEDVKPMEEISEETSDESNISSSNSDEEGETPEFVPSAWDKFATPAKSALRSPEKTLLKSEKQKPKGVWFKKQKYHCIYEYPREPESPVLQSQDLWKPQIDYSSFTDWEFDADTYLPPPSDDSDTLPSTYTYQPKSSISSRNLYQLTSITDFFPSTTGLDDEFFISSSAKPFDDEVGSLSSQFFPGNTKWTSENVTPDSGVEDAIFSNLSNTNDSSDVKVPSLNSVESLRELASEAVKRNKQRNSKSNALGGLRHTRNKLKLDLPPSPNAFTSTKMFSVEPILEPVIREKPTFTTFGKSRFLVQHIDTPPGESKSKNVSFEALPYKPLIKEHTEKSAFQEEVYQNYQTDEVSQEDHNLKEKNDSGLCKGKIELVKGEANLLDSADEDSGIESTLERKLSNNTLLK